MRSGRHMPYTPFQQCNWSGLSGPEMQRYWYQCCNILTWLCLINLLCDSHAAPEPCLRLLRHNRFEPAGCINCTTTCLHTASQPRRNTNCRLIVVAAVLLPGRAGVLQSTCHIPTELDCFELPLNLQLHRMLQAEVIPTCRELGIAIVPYSPLGRGFLTGNIRSLKTLHESDVRFKISPRFQGKNLDKVGLQPGEFQTVGTPMLHNFSSFSLLLLSSNNSLGLPLGLEAPVMTPDGVKISFVSFSFSAVIALATQD